MSAMEEGKSASAPSSEGCCGGRPCCFDSSAPSDAASRFPALPAESVGEWVESPAGSKQFDGRSLGGECKDTEADPYTYAGARLAACAFPLGGFGAGHLVLRGDGTLQKW